MNCDKMHNRFDSIDDQFNEDNNIDDLMGGLEDELQGVEKNLIKITVFINMDEDDPNTKNIDLDKMFIKE